MKTFTITTLLAFVFSVPAARGQTVLHDDFDDPSERLLNTHWSGYASGSGGLDFSRRIQQGELSLQSTSYGTSTLGVRALGLGEIGGIGADVQIERAISRVCETDGYETSVAWVLGARFFRATPATSNIDATGDVGGYVELEKRSTESVIGHVMARCRVAVCMDADCTERQDVVAPVAMGLLEEDAILATSVSWDPYVNTVRCVAGGQVATVAYAASADGYAPGTDFEGTFIQHASTCPVTDSERSRRTFLHAYVDDVGTRGLPPPPPPPTDTCATAQTITLTTRPAIVQANTQSLADDYQAAGCQGAGAGGPDAVYELVIPHAANVRISTAGSQFDTAIYLTRTTACRGRSAGVELACSDDAGRISTSLIEVSNLAAGTYRIVVDGVPPAGSGDYQLIVETF